MGSKRTPVGWMGCESTHHPVTSNPQGGNPENLVAAPAAGEILRKQSESSTLAENKMIGTCGCSKVSESVCCEGFHSLAIS